VSLKKTQALMQYTQGVETVMPPKAYFTHILGFTGEQADTIIKMIKKEGSKVTKEVWKKPEPAKVSGFNTRKTSKNPTKKTGRSRNGLGSGSKT
jgi:hypothetical protein